MTRSASTAPLVPAGVALRDVRVDFGETDVLRGFSLTLEPGTVTALMGPNGVGKTTVARIVLGLLTPAAGTVARDAATVTTAVFQDNRLCTHFSADSNVALAMRRRDRAVAGAVLESVGIDADTATKPVNKLSGGQQRRVAIARALAVDAGLVVLDEPFTGIDTDSKPQVIAAVARYCAGRTCLLITHDAAEAQAMGARAIRMRRPTAPGQ